LKRISHEYDLPTLAVWRLMQAANPAGINNSD
jgi:hypothetical protein